MRRVSTSSVWVFLSLLLFCTVTASQAAAAQSPAQSPTQSPTQSSPLSPFPPAAGTPGSLPRSAQLSPLSQPSLSPGALELLGLEARFAQDVAKGGGAAFATWFAEDAVTLNNGKPAILGHRAIADSARWDPKTYQLSWVPLGAQMGPSGDAGFTWGHYDATGTDRNGQPIASSGRYITFWKKVPEPPNEPGKGGVWKVALDASSQDAPEAGECCALPKP